MNTLLPAAGAARTGSDRGPTAPGSAVQDGRLDHTVAWAQRMLCAGSKSGCVSAIWKAVAGIKQDKVAFFGGRNLLERVQRTMHWRLHVVGRNEPSGVEPADFVQHPAHAHVARQPLAAIR